VSASSHRSGWLLAVLVSVYCLLGTLYAVRTPKWQTPDEPAHFNYIQYLADNDRLPVLEAGDFPAQYLEEIKAAHFPPGMSISPIRYESHQPPLYYAWASLLYAASRALPFDLRFLLLRLLSVALGACVLLVAYQLVTAIFPGEEMLALGATAFIALIPMHIALTAAINNDTLAELLLMLLLWQCVLMLREGVGARRAVGSGVLLGLALLTKTTVYLPAAGAAVAAVCLSAVSELRQDPGARKAACMAGLRYLLLLGGVALLVAGPWFVRNALVYGGLDMLAWTRHETVVAGQLRTAEKLAQQGLAASMGEFVVTSFHSFWAQFGWMGVPVDQRIYWALALFSAVCAVGLALYALPRLLRVARGASPARLGYESWQVLGLQLLALSALLTVLTYIGYNLGFWQPQGRYLFPALGPLALAFALALRELLNPRTARRLALIVSLAGLLLLGYALWQGHLSRWMLALCAATLAWFGAAGWLPARWRWLPPALLFAIFVALNLVCVSAFIVPYLS